MMKKGLIGLFLFFCFLKFLPTWVILVLVIYFVVYFAIGIYEMYSTYRFQKKLKNEPVESNYSYTDHDEYEEENNKEEKSFASKYYNGMYNPASSDYYKLWSYSLRDDK